jgi:hypothetical protein
MFRATDNLLVSSQFDMSILAEMTGLASRFLTLSNVEITPFGSKG